MRRVTQNGKRNASPVVTPNHLLTLHLVGKQDVFVCVLSAGTELCIISCCC